MPHGAGLSAASPTLHSRRYSGARGQPKRSSASSTPYFRCLRASAPRFLRRGSCAQPRSFQFRQADRDPVGAGLERAEELEQVAEELAAPIIKALLGKAAVPDDSPYTTGGIGLLGTSRRRKRWKTATRCSSSALLSLTSNFFPNRAGARRPDRTRSGADRLRYPVEVGSGRRLPAHIARAACPCCTAKRTAISGAAQAGMKEW